MVHVSKPALDTTNKKLLVSEADRAGAV